MMPRHNIEITHDEPLEAIITRFRATGPEPIQPPILTGLDTDLAQRLRNDIGIFNNAVYCWLREAESILSNLAKYDVSKSEDLIPLDKLKQAFWSMKQWWNAAGDVKWGLTRKEKELKDAGRSWATRKRFSDVDKKMWDTYADMSSAGVQVMERLDGIPELRGWRVRM